MNYSEFKLLLKEAESNRCFYDRVLAAIPCKWISKYFSFYFYNHNISPNKVTILMILFGLIGGVLFALPSVAAKIVGYIFFVLWFTMDNSDGEVARITKNFSKYGVEMDYMAHLICHPLMNISFYLTYLSTGKYDFFVLSLIFIVFISMELICRNFISFQKYINGNVGGSISNNKFLFRHLVLESLLYPNFVIFFTPFIILDYANIISTYYVLIVYVVFIVLIGFRSIFKQLMFFYRG